jgi:light-regulated signal transduction histidine kinase (bacteriophytochrome)
MKSSRRMWQMIDGLLDLSRSTRGRVVKEKVDLSPLAQGICSDLAKAEPTREVTLRIAEQVTGWGDARMIRVVLGNLLGNAWKFTAFCDDPVIEFFSAEMDQKSVYGVRDNGAGFDMAYADKLFAPFQRLHPKDHFAGSGIGLATVRRILNRHNGKIWAEAEPGKGAVFYFTL